jgi:hypothetical protein
LIHIEEDSSFEGFITLDGDHRMRDESVDVESRVGV